MIHIKKSSTADTRTCDWHKVSEEELLNASKEHIEDVKKGLQFFIEMIMESGRKHDWDKLERIGEFHADFKTGFDKHAWWDNHKKVNRHHLLDEDGVPDDVNLIDVLEMATDCAMAGMARSGEVYTLSIDSDVLTRAFKNTIELLTENIIVDEE